MRTIRRIGIAFLAVVMSVTACGGGGESEEHHAAVVEMLERLNHSTAEANCMADEFDGSVSVDDLQQVIDARGDYTGLDFELVEKLVNAEQTCAGDG